MTIYRNEENEIVKVGHYDLHDESLPFNYYNTNADMESESQAINLAICNEWVEMAPAEEYEQYLELSWALLCE